MIKIFITFILLITSSFSFQSDNFYTVKSNQSFTAPFDSFALSKSFYIKLSDSYKTNKFLIAENELLKQKISLLDLKTLKHIEDKKLLEQLNGYSEDHIKILTKEIESYVKYRKFERLSKFGYFMLGASTIVVSGIVTSKLVNM